MNRKIDVENRIVFFEGDFPSVMGVPYLMRTEYPGFNHQVLTPQRFRELDYPLTPSHRHPQRRWFR